MNVNVRRWSRPDRYRTLINQLSNCSFDNVTIKAPESELTAYRLEQRSDVL